MFNPGIFDNGVLIPKLLNNLFASCSFINLAFLFLQTGQIDLICNLPFFLLIILASLFPVFFSTHAISLHVYVLYLIWLKNVLKNKPEGKLLVM